LIRDNPGRPVPEGTFTHSHPSESSCFLYHLSPFATVHGILFVEIRGVKFKNGSPDPDHAPFREDFSSAGWDFLW